MLSYGDGRYLFVDEFAQRIAARVGTATPIGKRIFDVAPALQATVFGRRLALALRHGTPGRSCERMDHIFPGARLAAVIEPKPYAVFVRFRLAGVDTGGAPDAPQSREEVAS
jgi:hypothetical protein